MRLLRRQPSGEITRTSNLVRDIPRYAILSHTWGADHDEVSFDDFTSHPNGTKSGYRKIQFCAQQAMLDGIEYFWIDTCCIDKANHTELSEAIASMYRWYQNAEKCYVYLSDVSARDNTSQEALLAWETSFVASRWFTRGWTLQELLAPRLVEFFSRNGENLGDRTSLEPLVQRATNIPVEALRGTELTKFGIKERMSWASRRHTTRKEDGADCLQGLFGVFIPLICGEEENAFVRLEELSMSVGLETRSNDKLGPSQAQDKPESSVPVLREGQNLYLHSLAFPEMHDRRLHLEPRHQSTCEWILETTDFKRWTAGSCDLLWIKGKPGAGKSTIMAFIYDQLQKPAAAHMRQPGCIQLAFFFNARGTELQFTFQGMLRSLLHQLSLQDLSAGQQVQDAFDYKCWAFGSSPNSWQWQLSELKALLTETVIAVGQSRPLGLFVDALDEAGEMSARQIAQYFHQLNEKSASEQALVKICISCRHHPIVVSGRTSLEVVVEEHNQNDINAFIRDTLLLDRTFDKSADENTLWRKLESELNNGAQGSFQWARLVVPMVQRRIDKGESPEWILKKLKDVPEELRDVYKHIILNVIDKEDRQLSFGLFQWVCLAGRPLTVTEMRYALCFTDSRSTYKHTPFSQTRSIIATDDRMRLQLRPLSGGLIETSMSEERGQEYVHFGHQSVSDFMVTGGLELSASLSIEAPVLSRLPVTGFGTRDIISQCQARLYWACLEYLNTDDVVTAKISRSRLPFPGFGLGPIQGVPPFAIYAAVYIVHHAVMAGSPRTNVITEEITALLRIFPQWPQLCFIYSASGLGPRVIDFELLHFAAMANMVDVVRHLLRENRHVHVKDYRGASALRVAVQCGHPKLTALLLQHGADVNDFDQEGCTALFIATKDNNIAIAKLLLDYGAQPNAKSVHCQSAFSFAAGAGSIDFIRLFMARGAKLDLYENEVGSALQAASMGGHEAIVRTLLAGGANIAKNGGKYGNALQAASVKGREAVVKILLNAGANVDQQGGKYGNALQGASAGGSEGVVRLLLQARAGVNQRGGLYETAMRAAIACQYPRITKLLADAGADGYEEVDDFDEFVTYTNGMKALMRKKAYEEASNTFARSCSEQLTIT